MFLPTTIKEVRERGWEQLDVILFSGDAYIDHPAFGAAVVGRLLEAEATAWRSFPSPTGATTCATSANWALRACFSAFRAARWTRWSTITPPTSASQQRRLHARRQGGIPPRLCRDGLFADPQAPLPPRSGGHRGHRSLAAPPDPLRLLERRAETLRPGRMRRRPADLRHGRTGRAAGGPGMRNGYNAKLLRKIRQVAFLSDESYVARLDPPRRSACTATRSV